MTTHRLARIWKEGARWHWYLLIAGPGDASHARVWQGDEPTWNLARLAFLRADKFQRMFVGEVDIPRGT